MSSCPRVLVPPASVCSCRNASRWVQKAIYAGRAKTAIERVKLKSGVTTAHSLENNRVLDLRAQVRRLSKFLYNVTNIAVDDCKTLTRYRNRGDGSAQGARPPRMDTSAEDGEHHWASTDAQYNWFVSASDLSDALAEWRDFETRMAKHIRIEEGAIFPSLARHYPALDFSFLYEDHEELGQYEKHIGELLQTASSSEDAAEALRATVKFDLEFMDHLGEEEEFVVPLCLSTKHCALHGR